jgi:hypothetical protein
VFVGAVEGREQDMNAIDLDGITAYVAINRIQ